MPVYNKSQNYLKYKKRRNLKNKATKKTAPKRRYNKRTNTNFKNKVLSVLRAKQEPKYFKTPINCTIATGTTGGQSHVSYLNGTSTQTNEFQIHRFRMPDGSSSFLNMTAYLGDGRQAFVSTSTGANTESNQQKINLTRITARLNVTSSTSHDTIFQWWIVHTKDADYTEALFTTDLKNSQLIAPVYSVKSAYTQRAIQGAEDTGKQFKVLARGSKLIKRNEANDSMENVQMYPSYSFGKNGKEISFSSSGDSFGDIGNLYLLTSCMNTNGVPGSSVSFNGIQSVYFTDVIGQ